MKILRRILIALIVLVLLAILAAHFFLDGAIKRGVETFGPKLTKTEVTLSSASLSLLSDKVIVKSVRVEGPEITFETDLKNVNLKKILANVDEATGGSEKEPSP